MASGNTYAQVVFNLPIEGPFDYFIPPSREKNIKPGMRVRVSFGRQERMGYVVGKTGRTAAKKVKPILKVIDDAPVLDRVMLKITRRVADYYACSWGEAIETAVPVSLRQGKRIAGLAAGAAGGKPKSNKPQTLLLQDVSGQGRWEIYFSEIKNTLDSGKGVIFLAPDRQSAESAQELIRDRLSVEAGLLHSYQPAKKELEQWLDLKCGKLRIAVGTRMAVFAPLANPGLIIIEEEQNQFYKQDSTPHYNAVGVAGIRAKAEGLKLILSSHCPTLESWYQAKKDRIKYIFKDDQIPAPQVKIVDLHRAGFSPQNRKIRLSISLEDTINQVLSQKGRALIFLNRRGFAISASCQNCGLVLRCPRCNANLTLHFKNNKLICHRCNYRVSSPRVCPNCNSGYIRYSGLGTEKLESELSRLYPQSNIARMDKDEINLSRDTQIIVATESIFRHTIKDLDLIGVISPDFALNQPDFRAAEKLFALLLRLACLTSNYLIIQTNFPRHYCFQALAQRRIEHFYETELNFRRQTNLPPFNHIVLLKLRGSKRERVEGACEELFNTLEKSNRDKTIRIVSHSSSIPSKKRDKFYQQIIIKTRSVTKAVSFLKKTLNIFRRWGIIITVDVDPV